MSLFNPTRKQVRDFFFNTWQKYQAQQTLTDLEKIALDVILMHPEYHPILNQAERYQSQDYFPEQGETNPFLHLSLHLSVLEQISINQPTGITQIYQQLQQKHQDPHLAQHAILDSLAETIWQAQRNGTTLDSAHYLALLQKTIL